jgi:hypothetical protein
VRVSGDRDGRPICGGCVGARYLSHDIKVGAVGSCCFCGEERPCIGLEELADYVEGALERHYRLTPSAPIDNPFFGAEEGHAGWERAGDPVRRLVAEIVGVREEIAEEIVDILASRHSDTENAQAGFENPFGPDAHYVFIEGGNISLFLSWTEVEADLRTHSRFFNRKAQRFLDSIFSNIHNQTTADGRPVLVRAGPGEHLTGFYRARVFEDSKALEAALCRPDLDLGTPPARLARAGRMNAQGVAVFYGAESEDVALAEVRPPVGSQALTGRFVLTAPVILLDLAALAAMFVDGSIFDPDYAERLARARFLNQLVEQMVLPVLPGAEETDYLMTQMIADYLTETSWLAIDGILFPSVQRRGDPARNVVLFHHAAAVGPPDLPEGTEIEATVIFDGDEDECGNYQVSEYLPDPPLTEEELRSAERKFQRRPIEVNLSLVSRIDPDLRLPTLAVDTSSLATHDIEAIRIETVRGRVSRHRKTYPRPECTWRA